MKKTTLLIKIGLSFFLIMAIIDPIVNTLLTKDIFTINNWISKENLLGAFLSAILFALLYNIISKKKK